MGLAVLGLGGQGEREACAAGAEADGLQVSAWQVGAEAGERLAVEMNLTQQRHRGPIRVPDPAAQHAIQHTVHAAAQGHGLSSRRAKRHG